MHCKSCQYPLWKLSARACPECGAPFKPSDFDFRPESVRFCCPHCWQTYYGTDDRGHLVPRAFTCVKCSQPIDIDQMVLLPAQGFEAENATDADTVPWFHRRAVGWLKALWRTTVMGAFKPHRLGDALKRERARATGLGFALILSLVFGVLSGLAFIAIPLALAFVALATTAGGMRGGGVAAGFLGFIVAVLLAVVGTVVLLLLSLLIWAVVAHLLLLAFGARAASLRDTFRVICLTSGANLLLGVPCFGSYFVAITWIWWVISAGLCMARTHLVSPIKGIIAAAVMPVAVAAISFSAIFFWAVPAIFNAIQQAQTQMQAAATARATQQTTTLAAAVIAASAAGRPPIHAAELVLDRAVYPADLTQTGSAAALEPTVANTPLSAVRNEPESTREQLRAAIRADLPPDATHHRLGDFVFIATAGILDQGVARDPGLWILLFDPVSQALPGSGSATAPTKPPQGTPAVRVTGPGGPIVANLPVLPGVIVAKADGSAEMIPFPRFAARLAEQNTLRATVGLPALNLAPESAPADPAVAPPVAPSDP